MPPDDLTPFHSQLPVKIAYGDGALGELAGILGGLGASTALVVMEEPVAGIPGVAEALVACESAGIRIERHLKPPGEPSFAMGDDVARAIVELAPGAVVGIGGGSALDLAKAARVIAQQGGPATRFADGAHVEPQRTPLVLAPTTSGTGSEVSGAAVLTDKSSGRKAAFGSPLMRAEHALVDPLLTVGLPAAPTMQTGVDALAQSIGGVIVNNGSALSVAVGLEGIRHAAAGLGRAVRDGSDLDARREMSLASLLGGLAMNLSDPSADHALGQAIGSLLGLPHGLTIGVVLASTLEVSRRDCAARLERVADALGVPDDGSGDGSRAVQGVERLLTGIGFPTCREAGVGEQHVDELTRLALGEQRYFLDVDPHEWDEADVRGAFVAALAR